MKQDCFLRIIPTSLSVEVQAKISLRPGLLLAFQVRKYWSQRKLKV